MRCESITHATARHSQSRGDAEALVELPQECWIRPITVPAEHRAGEDCLLDLPGHVLQLICSAALLLKPIL
jgi:hypothetical protein